MNRVLPLAFMFALYACAQPAYTDVAATGPVALGDGVSVAPQIEWGQASLPGFKGTLWTVDGASLDALLFFAAEPGHALIEESNRDKPDPHVYQASMLAEDVMELTAANFEKLGFHQVKTNNLRPAPFGNAKGFRFEISYMSASGLQMKGTALGCQRNGKLDLIVFTAPAEYYFGHYAPTVDRVFSSVQVAG